MKLALSVCAVILLGVLAFAAVAYRHSKAQPEGKIQAVQLVITGPEGQQFNGSYVVDGVTNSLVGKVPATIDLQARSVSYSFKPADDRQEFRVGLDVNGTHRSSRLSYQGGEVKGGWKIWADGESTW